MQAQAQEYNVFINDLLRFSSGNISSALVDKYYSEASLYNRDFGLEFRSSVNHKFGEGFIEDDLGLSNLQTFYKAGVNWNILSEGFYDRRLKANQSLLKAEFEELNALDQSKREGYYFQYAYASYYFEKKLIDYYDSRISLLRSKAPLFSSLREEGYFTNRELMDLEARMEEAQFQKDVLISSTQSFEAIFSVQLPYVTASGIYGFEELPHINLEELVFDLEFSPNLAKKKELNKALIEEPNFWSNNVRLNAHLYYNHQVSFSDDRRDYVSVGVSLAVPLSNSKKEIRQKYNSEVKYLDEVYEYELSNRKKEILMLYQEYTYKQKQRLNTIALEKKLAEKLRVLDLQKKSVNTTIPAIDASLLQDEYLAVQIETAGLTKQMTQLLLKINLLLVDSSIEKYLVYKTENLIVKNAEVE
ncbi:MAG: hypothetical protein ED557_01215 [Balneola sp.]|nr:MAG: hypothetical protein ED557_01215 [Balneola sp.]